MKKNSIENQKRRPNLIRLVGRDGQTRPLDFFKLNGFLKKNNVLKLFFRCLKKLQEAYNYFFVQTNRKNCAKKLREP